MNFKLHIVEANVPVVLSIDDMDYLGVFFNSLTSLFIHEIRKEIAVINRFGGPLFRGWRESIYIYFNFTKLHRLRRSYGYPHMDKLYNVI